MELNKTRCNACHHLNRWHSYKWADTEAKRDHNRVNSTTCVKCGSTDVKNVEDEETMGPYHAMAAVLAPLIEQKVAEKEQAAVERRLPPVELVPPSGMTEERWQRMKRSTWFREEQERVILYVEELRTEIDAQDDSKVECPECGKAESVRTIEEITEHLGGPEEPHVFDFDYTFKAPVFTCPCGFAWTGHEREEASTEARRLEVEKRFRDKVLEERRRDVATAESIDRMRSYFAEGTGIKEPVGGVEAMMLSLAVEAQTQRQAAAHYKQLYETSERVTETRLGTMKRMCAEALGVTVESLEQGGTEGALANVVERLASLQRFKSEVDWALNSGDGVYRP